MNENLERVLRVLKHRGLAQSTSDSDLAKFSGLSRQSVSRAKKNIQVYLTEASAPSKSDEDWVDQNVVSTLVEIALTSGSARQHFMQVTGAVAGFVLSHKTDLINDTATTKKIVKIGQEYLKLVTQIESRKGGNGTPIHSQSSSARYLLNDLNDATVVDKLFTRTSSYRTDEYSKKWKLKPKAINLNRIILDETIKVIGAYSQTNTKVTQFPAHTGPCICGGKSVDGLSGASSHIGCSWFELSINSLGTLSVTSFLQVMGVAGLSTNPSCIAVPLCNLAKVDPDKGRIYNIFTRLTSTERKALGYRNYDISGGLQAISFNILYHYAHSTYPEFDDLHAAYLLIFQYAFDPGAKRALRQEIADDLGETIDEVKKLLTAYANGSRKRVGQSSKLRRFFEESDKLRKAVIAVIAEHEPEILKSAIEQSRNSFPEDMDWQRIEDEKSGKDARDKASVFFFVWTHFEKKIRDAMLSVVDDGIPVHDAIYSKHEVGFEVFETTVLEKTGFEVRIGS